MLHWKLLYQGNEILLFPRFLLLIRVPNSGDGTCTSTLLPIDAKLLKTVWPECKTNSNTTRFSKVSRTNQEMHSNCHWQPSWQISPTIAEHQLQIHSHAKDNHHSHLWKWCRNDQLIHGISSDCYWLLHANYQFFHC